MRIDLIVLISLLSFLLAFVSIPEVIKISRAKKIFDVPSPRKIHALPIPSLGGVGIFIALIFSLSCLLPFTSAPWIQYFIAAAFIIFFLGVKDDIMLLSPLKKFIGQVVAVFILIFKGGFLINSFHGFLGINQLHPILSIAFSFLTMLVVINAFNLIDGVDGLAGMLGLISSVTFGILFMLENDLIFASLSFSLASALAAFLIFNFAPAKIFMGDTGSLLLGLVSAILVVQFIKIEDSTASQLHLNASPALGFAILFVPLMDTFRVSLLRIYHGKSPFESDKNHIHHILLRRGYSHMKISIVLSVFTIACVILTSLAQPLGINLIFLGMFLTLPVMMFLLKDRKEASSNGEYQFMAADLKPSPSSKVVTPEGDIVELKSNL
jgi:UDP-N-acetylmuramyl pentapeptide phosphotransferase/UDP-N-acetylglucosamine-1-phosphate transferase